MGLSQGPYFTAVVHSLAPLQHLDELHDFAAGAVVAVARNLQLKQKFCFIQVGKSQLKFMDLLIGTSFT